MLVSTAIWAAMRPHQGGPALGVAVTACFLLMRQLVRRACRDALDAAERLRAIAAPAGDAWRRLFEAEGLGGHIPAVAPLVRKALRLTVRPKGQTEGRSRVGGRADLPAGWPWPRCAGLPMELLVQLDLAEIRRLLPESPLPAEGHLCFFYSDRIIGSASLAREACPVVHVPGSATAVPTDPPADAKPRGARTEPLPLELTAYEDLPDLAVEKGLAATLDEPQAETYRALASFLASGGDDPHHKLLGHAEPLEEPMELECARIVNGIGVGKSSTLTSALLDQVARQSRRWRLLLQLDSDAAVPWMWGDLGRVYFWIRDEDLQQHRLDRVLVLAEGA